MQNGVSSDVYEGEILAKNVKRKETSKKESKRKKRREAKKGKMRKKKKMRYSLDTSRSGHSHFEGDFLKF